MPPQRVLVAILDPPGAPRSWGSLSPAAKQTQDIHRHFYENPRLRSIGRKLGYSFYIVKYPVRNPLLEAAIKRVFNGRMMVVRQRQRIERLRNLRCGTYSAEQTLQELENSLAIFETHERELKERLNISNLQNRFRKSH